MSDDSENNMENIDCAFFGNLEYNLFLKINSKVCLIENISVKDGLVNGAHGTLKEILFREGKPYVLMIEFPSYSGVSVISGTKIVPIFRSERRHENFNSKNRVQFPVRLAYAMTIHKSQCSTLGK